MLKILDAALTIAIFSAYLCLILAPFMVDETPKPKRENERISG